MYYADIVKFTIIIFLCNVVAHFHSTIQNNVSLQATNYVGVAEVFACTLIVIACEKVKVETRTTNKRIMICPDSQPQQNYQSALYCHDLSKFGSGPRGRISMVIANLVQVLGWRSPPPLPPSPLGPYGLEVALYSCFVHNLCINVC